MVPKKEKNMKVSSVAWIFRLNVKLKFNFRYNKVFFTFQSIIIGVVGFWGGVFCMGLLYLLAVLTKRVFKPEEAEKIAD